MSSTAASSTSVTHRQHGQMHEIGSLQGLIWGRSCEIDPDDGICKKRRDHFLKLVMAAVRYPMIQMMAPTMETRTASSANGKPSSHPSGRHSPSPPQHMALMKIRIPRVWRACQSFVRQSRQNHGSRHWSIAPFPRRRTPPPRDTPAPRAAMNLFPLLMFLPGPVSPGSSPTPVML
jgi:hypothetical protein